MKKNRLIKIGFFLVVIIFTAILSGCGIGGWWMEGDPRLGHVEYRPEIADWINSKKDFMARKKDWIICGGNERGGVELPHPSGDHYKDSVRADHNYDEAQACMIGKGYRYIGSCKGPEGVHYACRHKK